MSLQLLQFSALTFVTEGAPASAEHLPLFQREVIHQPYTPGDAREVSLLLWVRVEAEFQAVADDHAFIES